MSPARFVWLWDSVYVLTEPEIGSIWLPTPLHTNHSIGRKSMRTTTRTQSQLLYRRSYKVVRRSRSVHPGKIPFKVVLGDSRISK
jgi:hypothetical protein